MMKLLHAADLHLDSPFSGLSPAQAAQKRAQQRELLLRLSETCRERGCQILLLSGDLFDGAHVYRDTLEALISALRDCGAEVFISPGNHDCLCTGSAYLTERWPDNVRIFNKEYIECAELEELGCRVYGAGFHGTTAPALLDGFSAPRDGLKNLMVIHGDALNANSDYNPVSNTQIADSGLDYLALGHIHKGGSVRAGKTLCAWPGCAMGRGFDETGEKGALEVVFDAEKVTTEFIPLGAGKYEICEVEAGEDPLAAASAALPLQAPRDVYRVIFKGESEAPDLDAIYKALAPRFFDLQLRDRTVPPVDLWKAASEDTLKGVYLRMLKEKYDAAPEEARPAIAFAARTGLAIMEQREVPAL